MHMALLQSTELRLRPPPPAFATFVEKVQRLTVGLLETLYIPPPKLMLLPFVIVRPLMTVPDPSPLMQAKTGPDAFPPKTIVAATT